MKTQKKIFMSADVVFLLKIDLSVKTKKKNVFVVRDEAPHFLRGPRLQPGLPIDKSSLGYDGVKGGISCKNPRTAYCVPTPLIIARRLRVVLHVVEIVFFLTAFVNMCIVKLLFTASA